MDAFSFRFDPAARALQVEVAVPRFDATRTPAFRLALDQAWRPEIETVAIDLARVDFIDSSGIGALLGVQKKLGSRGQPVTLRNPGQQVREVVELLRLHRVFHLS